MNAPLSITTTQKKLAHWLTFNSILLVIMIVVGGVTRLTGSGLSIVHWDVVLGIIPPLNEQAWSTLFQAYQQSPEYQQINNGMALVDFKNIFWLEYIHRLCGRLIGLTYLVPVIIAYRHKIFRHSHFPKLLGVWLLGALQGVVGWYMVKSGLHKDPHVSHYRLSIHLLLGFTTYGLTLYYTLQLCPSLQRAGLPAGVRRFYHIITGLFTVTVIYGAWVAGLKAGLMYNTFPTMDGQWIPSEILVMRPWWHNLSENHATVQWLHRVLALTTATLAIIFWWNNRRYTASKWVALAFVTQASLGVITLLMHVPITLGALHQAGALLVLASLIGFLFTKAR